MVTHASTTSAQSRLRMWLRPAIAAVVLGTLGVVVIRSVEEAHRRQLAAQLRTILRADVEALTVWRDGQIRVVAALAAEPALKERLLDVIERARDLRSDDALRAELTALATGLGHEASMVTDADGRIVCDTTEIGTGLFNADRAAETVRRALAGEPNLSIPFSFARSETAEPHMLVSAPVADAAGTIRGTLSFWLSPETEFTRILSVARSGETGETYAFDADGRMLSDTRFRAHLEEIGLLDPGVDAHGAILRVDVRDPGGNMVDGFRPYLPRRALPLTRMAASAIAGEEGVDVEGYRDYRGVDVVGAWKWLPEAGMGIATEVDADEAFASMVLLRRALGGLIALLVAAGMGVALYSYFVGRLQRRIARAERKAEKLGQYTLVRKIGAGGMGEVFLAKHSLLRRPTAVKLLHADRSDAASLVRFEREVQQSARLTHPNTISIYDYGRTPEGTFYYAMEYLDGIALGRLLKGEGPLPEGRLVYILQQVCASLHEAHELGLIHRDIEPGNLMLCRRGGAYDVVKVLDFGLVKDLVGGETVELSVTGAITGTPLYMSPESIRDGRNVDARADIYAVGAVAYLLLTGEHVFKGESTVELIMSHIKAPPQRPSERFGRPFSRDLEDVILRCLEKSPDARYATVLDLSDALGACAAAGTWDRAHARAWWEENAERLRSVYAVSLPVTPGTPMSQPDLPVDLDGRLSTDA